VVLSACSSGSGKILPGAGQMGLPRAWLISGTRAVLASYWPTADESGSIFDPFYREFGPPPVVVSSRRAARALRFAQNQMITAGGWRSQPGYWAAFFVVGRD